MLIIWEKAQMCLPILHIRDFYKFNTIQKNHLQTISLCFGKLHWINVGGDEICFSIFLLLEEAIKKKCTAILSKKVCIGGHEGSEYYFIISLS